MCVCVSVCVCVCVFVCVCVCVCVCVSVSVSALEHLYASIRTHVWRAQLARLGAALEAMHGLAGYAPLLDDAGIVYAASR